MRGTFPLSRARRRGQALLLAVLIMIFAALVSAAFIGVVATNLNQTARQTDKERAIVAAKAGLDYVNRQLTYSPEGDRWRANPLPPSDPNYNIYYSQLDLAQGWAGQYAKFPDPFSAAQNGPQFLAKVERIPSALPTSDPEFSHAGSLKISVIGLSSDDPSAWHRTVAYKGGYSSAPVGQTMRAVADWDFKNNVVPAGQVSSYNAGTLTITIINANTDFAAFAKPFATAPVTPFAVTFANPRSSTGVAAQGAVVVNVAKTAGPPVAYDLTLAQAPASAPVVGDRVELAASLGAPTGVDYTNILPAVPANATPVNFELSDGATTGGTRVNGGLWWQGVVNADLLRSTKNATATQAPGEILASGTMAVTGNVAVQEDGVATSTLLAPSSNTSTNNTDLVNDGWNRLRGTPGSVTRIVADFRPPDVASGEGLERYRSLSRYSKPVVTTSPEASLNGYGEGIYIDNGQDKEKVYDAALAVPGRREMSQAELVSLWLSKATPTPVDYTRTGTPIVAIDANTSLEEQHMRGWVGPNEFRARGVEIELTDDYDPTTTGNQPGLIITRDPRDDNSSTVTNRSIGPVTEKAWNAPDGTRLDGVYRQAFPWPANGVVFAEGNVRIRGSVTGAPRSLTVVSMNNIYIENSLNAAPRKILLLAKRNVVMNPTRVLGMPDQQTLTTAAATVTALTPTALPVSDGLTFKQGDFIQTSAATTGVISAQGYVSGTPTATSVPFTPTNSGAVASGDIVRTPLAATASTTVGTNKFLFNTVTNATDSTQRRLYLPPAGNAYAVAPQNLRLAFNHEADRVGALSVGIEIVPGGAPTPYLLPGSAYFANKGIPLAGPPAVAPFLDANASVVPQANKTLHIDYSDPIPPGTGTDDFPNPAPATDAAATAIDLTSLSGSMNLKSYVDPSLPGGVVGWRYKTSVLNGNYGGLPFYALAGVGNRYDFGITAAAADGRKNITTTAYEVPLATSIGIFLNGGLATVYNEHWNAGLTTPNYDLTHQFGFSPTFTDPIAPPVVPAEDVLTGDQGFYQDSTTANILKSTLDSRSLYDVVTSTSALNTGADNALFLRQGNGLVSPSGGANYPTYRLFSTKLENVALTQAAGITSVAEINPAYTFDVNAYVYAQTGSWFVIPTPLFDERLRGVDKVGATEGKSYLDLNNNNTADAGEYLDAGTLGVFDAGDYPDLNRNGTIDDFEKHAIARYSRYNYQILFTGAIAENQTALINDAGTGATAVPGAVSEWMSKWGTTQYVSATGTLTHGRIQYTFDPSVALGYLDDDPTTVGVVDPDPGFHMPQTPQLSYES